MTSKRFSSASKRGAAQRARTVATSGDVVREVRYVDANGRRVAAASIDSFLRVTGGRYVTFASGAVRDFDLVVGAGGVHSEVRRMVFGPQEGYERYLGICAAAYTLDGYTPPDELVYVLYSEIGRQAAQPNTVCAGRVMAPGARVVLLGDAASCVSLLAGEGSSLAMAAAYILAGELARAGDDDRAGLVAYEARFRPCAETKQRTALRFASSFAPTSRRSMLIRNVALDLMNVPWLGDRIIGAMLHTRFTLPSYQD